MGKALTVATFDYSKVDKETKGKLIALAGQLKHHSSVLTKSGNEIGKIIVEAHDLLAKQRAGLFDEWVERESDVSLRTAYNCINVEKRAVNFAILQNLPPTVAYMLSGPKVPDAAIEEFEKQIDKGVRPTVAAAKATLNKFRAVAAKTRKKKAAAEPEQQASNPDTADDGPLNDEPEKEPTFAESVKDANGKIESFCRQLVKFFEDGCPKVGSVDHMGRYDSALAQVRAACSTLRTCKYQDEPCPKCKGNGCATCEKESDFGAVSVLTYRQLAG